MLIYLLVQPAIVVILLYDFFDRGWGDRQRGPLARVSKLLLRALPIQPKWVDIAPRRRAARLGFFLCLGLCLIWFEATAALALALGLVVLFIALLEVLANKCIGCIGMKE